VEHREKIAFQDAGFGIETQLSKTVRLGLRTGFISDKRANYTDQDHSSFKLEPKTSYIFNPHLSLERGAGEIGLGPLFATEGIYYPSSKNEDYAKRKYIEKTSISYHLRLGNPKTFYASLSRLENIPLISGGGFLNYGLGTEAVPRVSLWVGGSGTKPFDDAALLLKVGVQLSPNWSVCSAYRSGKTHGEPATKGIQERAFSVKLNYRFFRK
jgi:hypothetical protein